MYSHQHEARQTLTRWCWVKCRRRDAGDWRADETSDLRTWRQEHRGTSADHTEDQDELSTSTASAAGHLDNTDLTHIHDTLHHHILLLLPLIHLSWKVSFLSQLHLRNFTVSDDQILIGCFYVKTSGFLSNVFSFLHFVYFLQPVHFL